jgi:hypothetical protein
MRQRAVRLPVSGATARLSDRLGQLVNLSIGGALLKLDAPLPTGGEFAVILTKGPETLRLPARVVRSTPATQDAATESAAWFVAIEFVRVPNEARAAMPRLVAPNLAVAPKYRSAAR